MTLLGPVQSLQSASLSSFSCNLPVFAGCGGAQYLPWQCLLSSTPLFRAAVFRAWGIMYRALMKRRIKEVCFNKYFWINIIYCLFVTFFRLTFKINLSLAALRSPAWPRRHRPRWDAISRVDMLLVSNVKCKILWDKPHVVYLPKNNINTLNNEH